MTTSPKEISSDVSLADVEEKAEQSPGLTSRHNIGATPPHVQNHVKDADFADRSGSDDTSGPIVVAQKTTEGGPAAGPESHDSNHVERSRGKIALIMAALCVCHHRPRRATC